jgi:N-methylhydantoinase A
MRLACDTGGTFTDLLVEADDLRMYKAHTVAEDPARGVLDALSLAAADRDLSLEEFLGQADVFIHGTTHAINAIITGNTAKTAFLTTAGHPDVLVIREGGRADPFDHKTGYPKPYVPRALTFEIDGRIDASGAVLLPLDEGQIGEVIERLRAEQVEAVAVCLLWSIMNPDHELRLGAMLAEALPDVAVTLSHQLNPSLREYRRASATAIDASLKPLMARYLGGLGDRLREAGFHGRLLVLTSQGGAMDAGALARTPIQAINSGPSMAPIAGRASARADQGPELVIVADTGGTTFDVSLIRGETIPWTRETWIGQPYSGHMTGFPSVDVKSVGAGGGSIAHVDEGGVLHVGPRSAGSLPGPVCYGRGGHEPTVTDACVVLGYIDPDYFLGGSVKLDAAAARAAIVSNVAEPLGVTVERAASAIIDLATENMAQAISDITVKQGIDPREAMVIGGGGAAGLNTVLIGQRLGCRSVLFPEPGAALSAAGALISDLGEDHRMPCFTSSGQFDFDTVNAGLSRLRQACEGYASEAGADAAQTEISFAVEARYPAQVWDVEVALADGKIDATGLRALVDSFHAAHVALYATSDPSSPVEVTSLTARVRCRLRTTPLGRLRRSAPEARARRRRAYFPSTGWVDTVVASLSELPVDGEALGPAIVETPFTSIVVQPGARYRATATGSLMVHP